MVKHHARLFTILAFLGLLVCAAGPAAWLNVGMGQGTAVSCYFETDNYQIAEDGKALSIKIKLSAATMTPVSVSVKTQQCTATANVDYQAIGEAGQAEKVVTFPPNTTEQMVTIAIYPDTYYEGNETFSVVLYSP